MKSYTDIEQSRKLAEILPLESADMCYPKDAFEYHYAKEPVCHYNGIGLAHPCWSLAALLNILHSKTKNIPSLSGGGYKDGKYTQDWCLDYEFDNGDYQKTFADNPVDACVAMIERLHEQNML